MVDAATVTQDPAAASWCDGCSTRSLVLVDVLADDQIVATLRGCTTCQTGIYDQQVIR